MTNYTWTAAYPDWITDPRAWGSITLPASGDDAAISAGYAYDWNASTPAYYTIGNQNPYQAPLLFLFGNTGMGSEILGYASVLNYGNSLFNATIGDGAYWQGGGSGGFLNFYNYGTVQGNINVLTVGNSYLNLMGGGNFGGSISFESGYHSGSAPSSISNNLLPGTAVHDDVFGAGNGPATAITFSGRADSSDVFYLGGNADLTLTRMQFLPSVNLESNFSEVVFNDRFSTNLQAYYHDSTLTIYDFGFGRALQLHVTPPSFSPDPNATLTLTEGQNHGGWFYGLALTNSSASGPGVIHPISY